MKVILYMAMTVNGIIARSNDDTSFVSDIEWDSFIGMIRKCSCVIIGRRTHEVMLKSNEFEKIKGVRVIVVSSNKKLCSDNENISIAQSPGEALKFASVIGLKRVLVAGGGNLNASFLREKLVDEIYLDLEPILFGKGIKLFVEDDFEVKLELLGTKKISKNVLQLHYKVIK